MKTIALLSLLSLSICLACAQEDKSIIKINDICIEHLCLGDSILDLLNYLGSPDTIIFRPIGDEEFEEPSHNLYFFGNDLYYELLYPNISNGYVYGVRISKIGVSLFIGDLKMIIGETNIEAIQDILSKYHFKSKKMDEKNCMYSFQVVLPDKLEGVKGGFISEVQLFFTNGILRQIWTPLDKN